MKYLPLFLLIILVSCSTPKDQQEGASQAETKPTKKMNEPLFFELRTYYAAPGKLDALLSRFEDHTLGLFEKNGMVNMGYWTPIENTENKLVYLLGFQDKTQRDASWEAFLADPEWKEVFAKSKENGALVSTIENTFLTYTDYSPRLKVEDLSPRVFSQRTYVTNEGKLTDLHSRFRDHTLKIFENNGMTNMAYFSLHPEEEGSDKTLIYFLTFPDTIEQKKSWVRFLEDEDWKSAYANSTQDGDLVNSITDLLLAPTVFSPLK